MLKTYRISNYLIIVIVFLLLVNVSLGYLLMRQSSSAMITLMQTRMLDISNTAAAMLDGDVLETLTPEDEGTPGYDNTMRILTYFQDNIELKYIYCIRDMGDGTFTFGLDPTVEDPGEFGSPIVYTDALYKASQGTPAADDTFYEDAWGSFYSSYTPVFNSQGKVAGIVAVDFSAEWYENQLKTLTRTTIIVSLLSLLVGGGIVGIIVANNKKRLGEVHGQLNEFADNLMHEIGSHHHEDPLTNEDQDIGSLGRKIQSMQSELRSQIAHVHDQAYLDSLTGVKNRNAYLDTVKHIEAMISDGNADFSLAVFDLNGLKTINDKYGHDTGDIAVRDAADVLSGEYGMEHTYRIGGDEFVIIMDGLSESEITSSLDRVDEKVHFINQHQRPYHIPLFMSKGYAVYSQGEEYAETFKRADLMMFDDKEAFYMEFGDRRKSRR